MRIGIVCYPTFGGSGVVATELGMALADKGHTVHFISYDRPVRLSEHRGDIHYHEVRVSDYPLFEYPPYELVLTSKIVDVARFEKLDILHVHYAIPHASAAWMAQQILLTHGVKVPFVTTLHGTDITLVGNDPSFEPVICFSIEKSDAVTAVSASLKADTYDHFDVKRDIEVIPNFVCLDQYRPEVDADLRRRYAPNGEKVMVHVSNFRPVKRVEDVVSVFKKVRGSIPVKLLLVGDGPDRQRIEQNCRNTEYCSHIDFLGKVKAPEDILGISDLFLLTSEHESFGLAALEAMASGVPVISSNTGGIPEVNKHGKSGFLSDVGAIDDMANNALNILEDDGMLSKFKSGALNQAKEFSLPNILPIYEELYNRVLERVKV